MEYEELENGTDYVVREYEEYEEYEEFDDRYGPATRNGEDFWNGQVGDTPSNHQTKNLHYLQTCSPPTTQELVLLRGSNGLLISLKAAQ